MKLLIRVVDDEPDVEPLFRQQFRRDLRDGRFAMEFAQSPQGALQRITECDKDTLPIRLSPTATSGSVRPCSWTFTGVAIFGSHNRSQTSSDFFPTTGPAPPTWRMLAGATGLFAPLSGGGRAVPLRKSSWRLALPQVPP